MRGNVENSGTNEDLGVAFDQRAIPRIQPVGLGAYRARSIEGGIAIEETHSAAIMWFRLPSTFPGVKFDL
jgi:hypothetical protein